MPCRVAPDFARLRFNQQAASGRAAFGNDEVPREVGRIRGRRFGSQRNGEGLLVFVGQDSEHTKALARAQGGPPRRAGGSYGRCFLRRRHPGSEAPVTSPLNCTPRNESVLLPATFGTKNVPVDVPWMSKNCSELLEGVLPYCHC